MSSAAAAPELQVLTRSIDELKPTVVIRLGNPWPGDAGPGGDSLGIDRDAVWLTDYHGGTVSRLELPDAVNHCRRER